MNITNLEAKIFEMHDKRRLTVTQIDRALNLEPGTAHDVMIDIWRKDLQTYASDSIRYAA